MAGTGSPGYFLENCRDVAAALPDGRAEAVKGNHTLPNVAAKPLVALLLAFFGEG